MAAGRQIRRRGIRIKSRGIRKQRIIVLGAGFGGLNAAQELARPLPFPENGHITLVQIVASPRQLSSWIHFHRGTVHEIDLGNKSVSFEVGLAVGVSRR